MESIYIYKDMKTGLLYPKFWLRCLVVLSLSFLAFWYAGFFGLDFKSLFNQELAMQKFLFFLLGGLMIEEWSFDIVNFVVRKYPAEIYQKKGLLALGFLSILLPCLFIYMLPTLFYSIYKVPMYFEFPSSVFLQQFLMVIIISAIHFLVNLAQMMGSRPIAMIDQNGNETILDQSEIAYIFYVDGSYFITMHNETHFDCGIDLPLATFFSYLDPQTFFMVNDHVVVSRKACKEVSENDDGTLKITLEPRPVLPRALSDKIGLGEL